ncbi:plasmid fertility inhibition factor family protein, partial [Ralstonia pseudosolanacearum]|uniref:plasmid fertility inhibition factor family protein n=1 Tax=Ralstonia pseudosolanacearum TaxID=1310165 RepID=UPI003CF3244E
MDFMNRAAENMIFASHTADDSNAATPPNSEEDAHARGIQHLGARARPGGLRFWPGPRVAPAARRASLDFDDGVTRIVWLLTQGARVFPVACAIGQADLLCELAGVPGSNWCRADELVVPYASDAERLAL